MDHEPGMMGTYLDGMHDSDKDGQRAATRVPGMSEVEAALEAAMRLNDTSSAAMGALMEQFADVAGEYLTHFVGGTHNGKFCPHCAQVMLSRLANCANVGFRIMREHERQKLEAANDEGPRPGDTVN